MARSDHMKKKFSNLLKYVLFIIIPSLSFADQELDDKIKTLKQEIKELRIKAFNKEITGDSNFRFEGNRTVKDLEAAEVYEDLLEIKERELNLLIEKQKNQ